MNKNIALSLSLIVLACLTSALMLRNVPHRGHTSKQPPSNHQPDAFMRDISYYQYDEQGRLHSHLTSPFITHYPQQNASRFLHPHYLIYTDKRVPWTITANYGKSRNGIHWVYLWGSVKVHEPQQPTEPETKITTTTLTIYPMRSFAKTNQEVTIIRQNAIIKATGMTADLKKGVLHLLSHSRGIYEEEDTAQKTSSPQLPPSSRRTKRRLG